ncbi:glycosyl hydrolase [Spirosoma pollinicola]|uniref:Glycoside hydrolase n=1 Tax=Spirosoma pollinicola TaxID=2057025 RepID=A0A2K8Z9D7_9BACT|nr:glycosyl hydrolase [Spirosoma pollinicola]AUD06482.1 glycoside hydrolase [Spirosoma pollinicola]
MRSDKALLLLIMLTSGWTIVRAQTPFKTLNWLYQISGTRTLAGQHNREPNAQPARWTTQMQALTGHYPALWSGDFLFQADNIDHRATMIQEAKTQWKQGALINLMWHACNPALAQPCGWDSLGVLSHLTDGQWQELLTDGSGLNRTWKARMDEVAIFLQELQQERVEVFFRPLHEMNQGRFWWGGRPGPTGTAQLYRLTHDYLVNQKRLTNLIWVWDVQDFGTLVTDVQVYNPGNAYWDVAALDVYDGSGYTMAKYETMVAVAKGKPVAIGECQVLPTASQLKAQPKWTFFMGWSELVLSHNSTQAIQALYQAPNVLTLDELPAFFKP